jgi:hypothetical protein
LEIPIKSRMTSFPEFFSYDRAAQRAYIEGLFGLAFSFAAIAILWFSFLILLKCKGRETGCASGHGFDRNSFFFSEKNERDTEEFSDDEDEDEHPRHSESSASHSATSPTGREEEAKEVSSPAVVVEEDGGAGGKMQIECCLPSAKDENQKSKPSREHTLDDTPPRSIPGRQTKPWMALEEHELQVTKPSSNNRRFRWRTRCGCCASHPRQVQKRRRRTRMTFLICSLLSLCCSGLLLTKVRRPVEEASETIMDIFWEGRSIIDGVQATLSFVLDATRVTQDIVASIPSDMYQLCPDIPPESFSTIFRVNPKEVMIFLNEDYYSFSHSATFHIIEMQEITRQIETGLSEVDDTIQENKDWLWVLSFWVGVTMSLTILSAIGVAAAIRNDTEQYPRPKADEIVQQGETRSQWMLSWVVLPTLILFTIFGWCLLIAASLSTVVATDVCTAGTPGGSPEETIRQTFDAWGLDGNIDETVHKAIMTYTTEVRTSLGLFAG